MRSWNAWELTGTHVTVGKEADLVVLGDDITKCDPEHIQDAPVLGTMVGGEWVYTCP